MPTNFTSKSIKFTQDMDLAISVIRDAGKWLQDSGKNPSQWWLPENINREFLLQYTRLNEFYVALIDDKPAAAVVLQLDQKAQDWSSVDKGESPKALYIHWLAVDREFAGQDLPKLIMEFAENLARGKGLKFLRLDANASNEKLIKLYENLGFELVATVQEDYQSTAFYQKEV